MTPYHPPKLTSERNFPTTYTPTNIFGHFPILTQLISQYIRINHHKIDCYVRGLDFYDRLGGALRVQYLAKS
jgi:hypothetical protein